MKGHSSQSNGITKRALFSLGGMFGLAMPEKSPQPKGVVGSLGHRPDRKDAIR